MAPDWFKKGTTREQLDLREREIEWEIMSRQGDESTPPETPRAKGLTLPSARRSEKPSAVKKWGERVALACGVVSLCGALFKSCSPAVEFSWHWFNTLASTDQLLIRDARIELMEKKLEVYNEQITSLQKDKDDLQKRVGELEHRLDVMTTPGTTVVGRRRP